MPKSSTTSIITCPDCHHHAMEVMPLDACIYLYECKSCQKLITPQKGDCCVYCSHGNNPCPTSRRERKAYTVIESKAAMAGSQS